jgi:hypothetical protein
MHLVSGIPATPWRLATKADLARFEGSLARAIANAS